MKKILLGVTGSVAAYKSADLARALVREQMDVRVVMTANAGKFITPLTFEALTGNRVLTAGFPEPGEDPMPHITLSREAALAVVAPATANMIGKLAHAIADDMLSAVLLTMTGKPVIVAPAMNVKMYQNPGVQENMKTLERRGVIFAGPASGQLACGDIGEGKMEQVDAILAVVMKTLEQTCDLEGVNIVVTAGGSREPIDAVRFIGNRSSGKMGVAIARAAMNRGANVTLVAGAMEIAPPADMRVIKAQTADETLEVVDKLFSHTDVLIMASAVGDYRAERVEQKKVKKKKSWTLTLTPNPDIIARMSARRDKGQIIVGFAAETEELEAGGKAKLTRKNLDMIVCNDVSRTDIGFGADDNQAIIITRDGEITRPPRMSKALLADVILDRIKPALVSRKKAGPTPLVLRK